MLARSSWSRSSACFRGGTRRARDRGRRCWASESPFGGAGVGGPHDQGPHTTAPKGVLAARMSPGLCIDRDSAAEVSALARPMLGARFT
jgi:hypothetical protein